MSTTNFQQRLVLQLLTKHRRLKVQDAQGFTLIELLVVIVILGVLGGVGFGAYVNQISRANANNAAIAATAMAKNCAALLVTGDQSSFEPAVDGKNVVANKGTGECQPGPFTVTAGAQNTNSAQVATATLNTNGAVIPATPPPPGP